MWEIVLQIIASAEFIAYMSLIVSIYTFHAIHKYKKPKATFIIQSYDKNNVGNMGVYIYNRMNMPLTIISMLLEERNEKYYETYLTRILGDNNNEFEGHEETNVIIPRTIVIQPYSCESFLFKYDKCIEKKRKPWLFKSREFYLKIITGDSRKFTI